MTVRQTSQDETLNTRRRLARFVIGTIVGSIAGWFIYSPLLSMMTPKDIAFQSVNANDPFTSVLWFSSAMALALALPVAFFPGRHLSDWMAVTTFALTAGGTAYLVVQRQISWARSWRYDLLPGKTLTLHFYPHLEAIPLTILIVECAVFAVLYVKSSPVANKSR
jgi:hypothetical protein